MQIERNNHIIKVTGTYHNKSGEADKLVRIFCRVLYETIDKKGFSDIILDFSDIGRIDAAFIVPLLPIINRYRQEKNIDFSLRLPDYDVTERLFINANWAHFIEPNKYPQKDFESNTKHIPTLQYHNEDELYNIVNKVLEMVAQTLENITIDDITAIEWSLNEIADNVLNHSQSSIGGFASASCLPQYYDGKKIEIIVADAGIGIPASLSLYHQPEQALQRAIEEGETRDETSNQGNGLYYSYQLAVNSESDFEISSHEGHLLYSSGGGQEVEQKRPPYTGTMVRYILDCADPNLLAMTFGDNKRKPNSVFIDSEYSKDFCIDLKTEKYARLCVSREGAAELRKIILNHINLLEDGKMIEIDFTNKAVITSSAADEIFGKLIAEIGMMGFYQSVKMLNMNSTIAKIIDKAVAKRLASNGNGHKK